MSTELLRLDPTTILVPHDRLRAVDPAQVEKIANSMRVQGQIEPITVTAAEVDEAGR